MKNKLKTHWVADIFPLNDSDIDAIAEDIKANGQLIPIKELADGRIVDGRTRWLACEKAGVEPVVETLNGDLDDEALLTLSLSLNGKRRDLSAAQRAAAAAQAIDKLFGEGGVPKGGRGNRSKTSQILTGFDTNKDTTWKALTLLREDRARFDLLFAPKASVTGIYADYLKAKRAAEKQAVDMKFVDELGFGEMVESGELTFEKAFAQANQLMEEIQTEEREKKTAATDFLDLLGRAGCLVGSEFVLSDAFDLELTTPKKARDMAAKIETLAANLARHLDEYEERQ